MKAVLLFAVLALACNVAFASHFRYMTMSWSRSSAASTEVKVKVQAAFNSTFFFQGPATIGQIVNNVGNINLGNGKPQVPVALRVTSYSDGNGKPWFIGETELTATYTSAGVVTVVWNDCCRIYDLEDSNDEASYVIKMEFDLASTVTQSARVTQFPLMYFILNQANALPLPFLDEHGAAPTFSIRPTSAGTGLITASPAGLTVTSGGVVNWTPTKAGLYAIQFGADTVASSLPLDLILAVVPATNNPPVILAPTVDTIVYIPGSTVQFDVVASDPESADTVTISSTSLPAGSTFPPCTPAQQCTQPFSWPTNQASGSALVCFQAVDNHGNPSAAKCVTLIPDSGPCPSGTIGGAGCASKTISNKCVGNGFNAVTESAGGCATISFNEFGVGC